VTRYELVRKELSDNPRVWVVTGSAGFIGSNLAEQLLRLGQTVVGLDNFATGYQRNVDDVKRRVGAEAAARYNFIEGDICNLDTCQRAFSDADIVLHQAAIGSVPRSIDDPIYSHESNVDGTLNVFVAARDQGIQRVVYASSSAVYGDHPGMPKVEGEIGNMLSPYAVTKYVDELYAAVFARSYGLEATGLRYFNVFGPRQDPNGAYAAVIPLWVASLLAGRECWVNGDGETSRDFCFIDNVVQANILAATTADPKAVSTVYNVAVGDRTTLNQLFGIIRDALAPWRPELAGASPVHRDFRAGDVKHSLADISRARELLGYAPTHSLSEGMEEAIRWYVDNVA
jgi:UDP-N-acetylglucosamine 4-epimerase